MRKHPPPKSFAEEETQSEADKRWGLEASALWQVQGVDQPLVEIRAADEVTARLRYNDLCGILFDGYPIVVVAAP